MADALNRRVLMKAIIYAFIFLSILMPAAYAFDPGLPDTVRVDSVSAMPGEHTIVPVYFFNDEPLSAMQVELEYDTIHLTFDSISYETGRLSYINPDHVIFNDSANLIELIFMDFSGFIPTGNGLLCNLYFTASQSVGGVTALIENGYWPFQATFKTTQFADSSATKMITPQFVNGKVVIREAPPSPDSVWVENISGMPNSSVAVIIYGYNAEDVQMINLALTYSSNSLIYSNTTFSGTRGETAFSKIVSPSGSVRQLLITLVYDSQSPLSPGSGPLARIIFDIDSTAMDEVVIIDSASYLGAQPLEFTLSDDYGNLVFTPYFTPGSVEIKHGTPVDEKKSEVIPDRFSMAQNVPNPFNPSTKICFALPRNTDVSLNVYNILGQKVRTLIDGPMAAGQHEVIFDGRGDDDSIVASGVYFYRIDAGEFHQSRKMTLMK